MQTTLQLNPLLVATFVIAIGFEIIFPLVVGFLIHRRFGVRWRFFLYGMLIFFLSQMLTRIPIVQIAQALLAQQLQSSEIFLYVWLAVLALTAGLFEEVGRYLGYRFLIKNDRTWSVGLMYGAGHGGLESMLLVGGLALIGLVNVIAISTTNFSTMNLPPEQLAQIETARQQIAGLEWWMPLLGAYERFITIFLQIAFSILVLQCFLRNSLKWLVIAIAYHALIDFGAIVLVRFIGPVWVEAALTVTLPISLVIISYFRPRESPNAPQAASA